jgi:hypothetical protein
MQAVALVDRDSFIQYKSLTSHLNYFCSRCMRCFEYNLDVITSQPSASEPTDKFVLRAIKCDELRS